MTSDKISGRLNNLGRMIKIFRAELGGEFSDRGLLHLVDNLDDNGRLAVRELGLALMATEAIEKLDEALAEQEAEERASHALYVSIFYPSQDNPLQTAFERACSDLMTRRLLAP